MFTKVEVRGGSANQQILTLEEFSQLFMPLVNDWKAHSGNGLKIRHKAGKELNQHIGAPTTRHKRGAGVVEKAGELLGVTKGEISRLRWFAHLFNSVEEFLEVYPNATSWAAAKAVLPKVKAERQTPKEGGRGDGACPGNAKTVEAATSKRIEKILQRLTEALAEGQEHLSRGQLLNLQGQVNRILDQVRDRYFSIATHAGNAVITPLTGSFKEVPASRIAG